MTYQLTTTDFLGQAAATFSVANFLTGSGNLSVSVLDSCTGVLGASCSQVSYSNQTSYDLLGIVGIVGSQTTTYNFFFDSTALGTVGTYTTILGNTATLVVGETSSAVPEPATWALMLVGFGAVGYGMRRKRTLARVTYP